MPDGPVPCVIRSSTDSLGGRPVKRVGRRYWSPWPMDLPPDAGPVGAPIALALTVVWRVTVVLTPWVPVRPGTRRSTRQRGPRPHGGIGRRGSSRIIAPVRLTVATGADADASRLDGMLSPRALQRTSDGDGIQAGSATWTSCAVDGHADRGGRWSWGGLVPVAHANRLHGPGCGHPFAGVLTRSTV